MTERWAVVETVVESTADETFDDGEMTSVELPVLSGPHPTYDAAATAAPGAFTSSAIIRLPDREVQG